MRMTATHAYVVTSSLYVHNLFEPGKRWWLNYGRRRLASESKWLRIGLQKLDDDWTLMDSRCKYIQECQGYRGRQSCFRCQHCHCRQEESHAFFQWSSTLYVIRTLLYFTLIAERRLGLTMMSIWYAGPVAYYGIYNGKNAHQAVIKNMIQIWGLVGLEK